MPKAGTDILRYEALGKIWAFFIELVRVSHPRDETAPMALVRLSVEMFDYAGRECARDALARCLAVLAQYAIWFKEYRSGLSSRTTAPTWEAVRKHV